MNQPSYPPPQWGAPPPGYPPPGPPPGGPPAKKPFRFQMWMLGALIIPVGIGFAVRDVLLTNSLELGAECSDSKHCKSHTCLTGEIGACTKTCNALDPCPADFACQQVSVTLQNQAGFHDLGAQGYCLRARAGTGGASATPSSSAAPPPPSATATASAALATSATATAPAAASAAPAAKGKPPKPKPKK